MPDRLENDDAALAALMAAAGQALAARGEMLATAESCTGGWLAKLATDIAGSSAWFERGLVTYSNAAKQQLLDVSDETLRAEGAVSAHVVLAMAQGLIKNSPAEWTIAVSGIAGPGGAVEGKPVGTVWIAWAGRQCAGSASRFQFSGNRDQIRRAAVRAGLENLLDLLKG